MLWGGGEDIASIVADVNPAKNYISAYTWLSLSAAQGNQIAIKRRDIIARHMTPAQIAKAQKLAREWKPTKQQAR